MRKPPNTTARKAKLSEGKLKAQERLKKLMKAAAEKREKAPEYDPERDP